MKSEILQDAIGEIKDEYIEDAHAVSIINNIKTAKLSAKVQFSWKLWGVMAACLCLMAIAGVATHNKVNSTSNTEVSVGTGNITAESDRDLELTSDELTAVMLDAGYTQAEIDEYQSLGYQMTWAKWWKFFDSIRDNGGDYTLGALETFSSTEVAKNATATEASKTHEKPTHETADCELTGTDYALENADGYLFLTENLGDIEKNTGWSSELTDEPRVSENGYSHLYIGDDGNELAVNVRDYLIYSGETLVCIATVTNDEKGMSYRLTYGKDWIDDYSDILKEYMGEELVYIYTQATEVVLTPDSKAFSPQGSSVPEIFETQNVADYYDYYKYPQNTLNVEYVVSVSIYNKEREIDAIKSKNSGISK